MTKSLLTQNMLEKYDISYKNKTNQILIVDKEGRVLDFESEIFKNAKGKNIGDLHPFFVTILKLLNEENKEHRFQGININIDGEIKTIDAVLHTNSKSENAVIVFQDLTTHYIKYQKVAQLRNEAEIKAQLLAFNNNLLQERDSFKDNFIANFSHEIRMPLNTISGFSILLEDTNLEQTQRYNLNIIKNTNDKLKVMINEILDISKIETGHFIEHEIRYNLLEELNVLIEIYTKKCEKKGLKLNYKIDKNCPKYVISDKYRLAQIASNLIGNALKFTTTGTIDLEVKCKSINKETASIEYTIKDTGIGIAKDQLDKIFNSFHQISNNLYNSGSGLGLAIVKKLVTALNGDITVDSELGKGTTFKVTLDYKIASNQEDDKTVTKVSKSTSDYEYKILFAEPLKKDQAEFLKILNATKKYDVVIVENGDSIVEELFKSHYDLVVLNIKLPTMDGIDTTRYIRYSEYSTFSNIPIIVVSNNPSKEEESYCKKRRINSYIGKPFNKEEVLRKIKYLLQKKQAE